MSARKNCAFFSLDILLQLFSGKKMSAAAASSSSDAERPEVVFFFGRPEGEKSEEMARANLALASFGSGGFEANNRILFASQMRPFPGKKSHFQCRERNDGDVSLLARKIPASVFLTGA